MLKFRSATGRGTSCFQTLHFYGKGMKTQGMSSRVVSGAAFVLFVINSNSSAVEERRQESIVLFKKKHYKYT